MRVMAAGVNYNNVWAALGQPVGVWRYGDHPEFGHHIGGSDASGIVWKVGEGVTRWKPGRRGRDPLQHGLLRGPRGARPRPDGRAQPDDLGLRDHLGLLRPVHQGPGPAAAAQAQAPHLGGGRLLRPRLLHRLPDADGPVQPAGRRQGADLGRRRRPRRVRRAAVRDGRRGVRGRGVQRREGRAGRAARRHRLDRPQRVQGHDAQGRRDARRGEGALQGVAPVRQGRQGDPRATRPTSCSSTSARPRSRRRCSR